jgi:hypothetical protein
LQHLFVIVARHVTALSQQNLTPPLECSVETGCFNHHLRMSHEALCFVWQIERFTFTCGYVTHICFFRQLLGALFSDADAMSGAAKAADKG